MNGFSPIFDKNSKILILGSFPSVKSREINFYYGNKRNRFWNVLGEYFGVSLDTIEEKTDFLLKNNIAIWDIIEKCDGEGSLDSSLKNIKQVCLEKILPPFSKISLIICNGKLSFNLTEKYLLEHNLSLKVVYLPSTSPANVNFDKSKWFEQLENLKNL